jgi:hypothetical protein
VRGFTFSCSLDVKRGKCTARTSRVGLDLGRARTVSGSYRRGSDDACFVIFWQRDFSFHEQRVVDAFGLHDAFRHMLESYGGRSWRKREINEYQTALDKLLPEDSTIAV